MELSIRDILRILDANLNRAREGLRVVEEIARFVLENKSLQKKTKSLRHRLSSLFTPSRRKWSLVSSAQGATGRVDRELLIDLGRDASSDVGKDFLISTEARRATTIDLIQANFARIEESVRALEEFTKFLSGDLCLSLKALRFEVYSLEKEYVRLANRASNIRSLKNIGLYPILDRESISGLDPLKIARQILVPGVRIIQYRDKISSAAEVRDVCAALREITLRTKVIFIVNDRVDIAQSVDADGVHLGQDDFPVHLARELLGSRKIIGKSTHSLVQAREAAKEDVDYLSVGPIFSTPTKPSASPVGVDLIAKVRRITDKPIIAIGGISSENAGKVFEKGADGASVISAILTAKDIRSATLLLARVCEKAFRSAGEAAVESNVRCASRKSAHKPKPHSHPNP